MEAPYAADAVSIVKETSGQMGIRHSSNLAANAPTP